MISIRTATNTIILAGLISTIVFLIHGCTMQSGISILNLVFFSLLISPYILLLSLSQIIGLKAIKATPFISIFIISTIVCVVCAFAYYRVIYHPGSSTDALVMVVLPVYSIIFILIAHPITKWVLNLIFETKNSPS